MVRGALSMRFAALAAIAILAVGCADIAGLGATPPGKDDGGTAQSNDAGPPPASDAGATQAPDASATPAGPMRVSGHILSTAPSPARSTGMSLVSGGLELGARTCSDAGMCVTGGLVP